MTSKFSKVFLFMALLTYGASLSQASVLGQVCRQRLFDSSTKFDAYFPAGVRVASFFSGRCVQESRVAAAAGITIDAYDKFRLVQVPAGVRFHNVDLFKASAALRNKYDRILMWNPWIVVSTPRVMNPEFAPPTEDTLGLTSPLIEKTLERLGESAKSEGAFSQMHPLYGGDLPMGHKKIYFDSMATQILMRERLAQLHQSISLARNALAKGGQIYLVTELFHTIILRPPYRDDSCNHLMAWPAYEQEMLRMLNEAFPGIHIEKGPLALKSLLLPSGAVVDNPWGNSALEVWVIH